MNVVVNGDVRELDDGATVAQLLTVLELRSGDGVAVARNGEVVLRSDWASARLQPGDRIEVLHAVQGG
jgi:sulfur carrier protein